MTLTRVLVVMVGIIGATAARAEADATAFLGATTTPESRMARGFAFGAGVLLIGFEFEYASTPDDEESAVPSLTTGMGNLLLQTPFAIAGFQPYVTGGLGLYRERLGTVHRETGFGLNTGAGVKVTLAGPIRLRVDYRVFRLGDDALHSPVHRVYAGLNLRF